MSCWSAASETEDATFYFFFFLLTPDCLQFDYYFYTFYPLAYPTSTDSCKFRCGEMKPNFITTQNKYVVYFSSLHHMKVPVHTTISCFTGCVTESVNHSGCIFSSSVAVCADAEANIFCANWNKDFCWRFSNIAPVSSSSFSSFSMYFACFLAVWSGSCFWNLFMYL